MKIIGNEAYDILASTGHCVPRKGLRNDIKDTVVSFTVGKEYEVVSYINKTPIKVRCTQNCPISIKII